MAYVSLQKFSLKFRSFSDLHCTLEMVFVGIHREAMIGIKEVAEATKLSRHTVSDILNCNDLRYSKKTRERVQKVAAQMGYRPNRAAQSLRRKRTHCIGVLLFHSIHELSEMRLINVLREVNATSYHPIVVNCNWHTGGSNEVLGQIIESRVSGVLLVNPGYSATESPTLSDLLLERKIPLVALGGDKYQGYPRFMSDKRHGFYQMTRHLLERGYQDVALLLRGDGNAVDTTHDWHAGMAISGYRECLNEFGLGEKEDVFLLSSYPKRLHLHSEYPGDPYLAGYESMLLLLQRERKLPEAVICSNDSWAYGALRACWEKGIRVPEDIAFCGFEDELSSRYGMLPLTTFRQPLDELARRAVGHLVELIENERMGEDSIESIAGKLIVRASSPPKRVLVDKQQVDSSCPLS